MSGNMYGTPPGTSWLRNATDWIRNQQQQAAQTRADVSGWMGRERAQAAQQGLWSGGSVLEGGHPTMAGLTDAAKQYFAGLGTGDVPERPLPPAGNTLWDALTWINQRDFNWGPGEAGGESLEHARHLQDLWARRGNWAEIMHHQMKMQDAKEALEDAQKTGDMGQIQTARKWAIEAAKRFIAARDTMAQHFGFKPGEGYPTDEWKPGGQRFGPPPEPQFSPEAQQSLLRNYHVNNQTPAKGSWQWGLQQHPDNPNWWWIMGSPPQQDVWTQWFDQPFTTTQAFGVMKQPPSE